MSSLDHEPKPAPQSSYTTFGLLAERSRAIVEAILQRRALPNEAKTMRLIPSPEAADFIPLSYSRFRHVVREAVGELPQGETVGGNNRRAYSVSEIHRIRQYLYEKTGDARYCPGRQEGDKLQVLAIANFKGGAAKTTTTIHLAEYLALRGYRVLAIDTDPQASLTSIFGGTRLEDTDDTYTTIYGPLTGRCSIRDVIFESHIDGLDYVGSNIFLNAAEFELPGIQVRDKSFAFHLQIDKAIREVEGDYDVVLIDCPPSLNYCAINAICAATALIVPAPPHMLDFTSTGLFFELLGDTLEQLELQAGFPKIFDFVRILLTRYDPNAVDQERVARWMQANYDEHLLMKTIPETKSLDQAGTKIETLYEMHDPRNRQTYNRGREAVDAVNAEIESLIRGVWGQVSEGDALTISPVVDAAE